MARVDVFSFAASVTALLLAVGLIVSYAVNRKLEAFRWWAMSFLLLAVSLVTATMRLNAPPFWVKSVSWAAFYAAACLIAIGLYRVGETRTNPWKLILAGAVLFLAVAIPLMAIKAPPHLWFLLGPVPTLFFMAWSTVLVVRSGAWGYGLALVAGTATIATRSIWFATDMMRTFPLHLPALRGTLAPDRFQGGGLAASSDQTPPPLLDFTPPPRIPPPVEQPLTISLITIAALLGLAIALVLRNFLAFVNGMRERSTTDAMTGLLNRATFDERATDLLEEAGERSICIVLLDIDHFKRVNDTCGHPTGDRVIARLGHLVSEVADERTVAGRIGGEEFAVILSDSNLAAARLFAEAIRCRFSASDFGEDIAWEVTLSAGIAMRADGETLRAVVSRADKALYAAKARGRDRVVVASDAADAQMLIQAG